VFNHLGQVVLTQGRAEEAARYFEQALSVDPHHADSLNSLANTLKARGALREAIDLYRRALRSAPQSDMSLYNLGNALKEAGEFDEALQMFERALACEPGHLPSHLNRAVLLEQKGRFEEAIGHYEAALKLKPDHPKALANLIALLAEPDPQLVRSAQQRLAATDLESDDRIKLHHGVGKHYDRQQDFDQAFAHFAATNALLKRRKAPFDPQQTIDYFDRIIRTFSADYFARLPARLPARQDAGGCASQRPVFIVGMPRSGTTLTEQILASHPAIFGAGELQDILHIVKTLKPRYPEAFAAQSSADVTQHAQRYLAVLEQRAPPEAIRVTDKLPVNFMHLGLIATLFPRARVIHCRRDPLDIGLSCFIERFELSHDFTTDLESFGHYFLQYERLMQHWRSVLPLAMHEQRYENLVADQEAGSRALVAFCDLPWDEACMDFQKADRAVLTPSRWQVRQPIYSKSVGRWRNYSQHMQPLRRLLEERGYRHERTAGSGSQAEA
jgi:tetratricopeptide (TPR) repeat protein